MENTLENKAAFFCLYWGQKVLSWDDKMTTGLCRLEEISEISEGGALEFYFLELNPLSQINDEDYKIAQKLDGNFGTSDLDYSLRFIKHSNVDYLRSKGYALPFRGVDVETLISWGWVKLKTKKE